MTLTETSNRCPDCQVPPGTEHEDGCDVAVCVLTGQQRLVCSAIADDGMTVPDGNGNWVTIGATHPGNDCGRDVWSGEWPGKAECREFGWHSYFTPGEGWVRCAADHPEATEDLNRLILDARWDATARRWVRKVTPVISVPGTEDSEGG